MIFDWGGDIPRLQVGLKNNESPIIYLVLSSFHSSVGVHAYYIIHYVHLSVF